VAKIREDQLIEQDQILIEISVGQNKVANEFPERYFIFSPARRSGLRANAWTPEGSSQRFIALDNMRRPNNLDDGIHRALRQRYAMPVEGSAATNPLRHCQHEDYKDDGHHQQDFDQCCLR
jgi:hypothetical protein